MKRLTALQKQLKHPLLLFDLNNIFYLSGFTGTNALMLVTKDKAHFFTDSRYFEQADKQVKGCEIHHCKKSLLHEASALVKNVDIEGRLHLHQYERIKKMFGKVSVVSGMVEQLRMVKDDAELATMKKAIATTAKAFETIKNSIKSKVKEKYIADLLVHEMRLLGADKESFDTIVASGFRSAMPHGVASSKRISSGPVTVDFGCIVDRYCSDLTRTVFVDQAKPGFKKMYQTLIEAQQLAFNFIKPGVLAKDVDAVARNHIDAAGYGNYFTHSLGHGIGLDVHEQPTISSKSGLKVEEGMVFTVEPGIYLPGKGGIRIEDMIVVTKKGCKVLSQKLSRELTIL